jgi:hypothetical protein
MRCLLTLLSLMQFPVALLRLPLYVVFLLRSMVLEYL